MRSSSVRAARPRPSRRERMRTASSRGLLEPSAQARCPRAKMAARCCTRCLLLVVGTPRLPVAAGRGARTPGGGVVVASLGRRLSVTAFAPSLRPRGPGALLTLRPGVSLAGEGRPGRWASGLELVFRPRVRRSSGRQAVAAGRGGDGGGGRPRTAPKPRGSRAVVKSIPAGRDLSPLSKDLDASLGTRSLPRPLPLHTPGPYRLW